MSQCKFLQKITHSKAFIVLLSEKLRIFRFHSGAKTTHINKYFLSLSIYLNQSNANDFERRRRKKLKRILPFMVRLTQIIKVIIKIQKKIKQIFL
jgi:flagellar biosynthesis regulator FlbT